MKNWLLILVLMITINQLNAQYDSLYISGRFLYNRANEKIILRGINYPVLDDWDFPSNMNNGNERLSEIAKTNANCVRIMWYNDYGQAARPAYNLVHLDSLLTRCARNKMIPIVGLWDVTCGNDWSAFTSSIINWWTQPAVVALFNKHKRYTIINFANEMGYYEWTTDSAIALVTFKTSYKTAITALRNAGHKVPLMIDAADCGTNADALISSGLELVNHDPLKNILLSPHAYWYTFTGNTNAAIENKLLQMVASNLPFVFGEIANYQTDARPCQYSLNYQYLLQTAKPKEIGWLAWSWYNDYCTSRQLSANGLFNNLTAFGNDIVNNSTYGLAATSIKSNNTFINGVLALNYIPVLQIQCSNNATNLVLNSNKAQLTKIIWQKQKAEKWETIKEELIVGGDIKYLKMNPSNESYKVSYHLLNGYVSETNIVKCNNVSEKIKLFPSIAKDYITVQFATHYKKAIIYNERGLLVQDYNLAGSNQRLNVARLAKGNYCMLFLDIDVSKKECLRFIKL